MRFAGARLGRTVYDVEDVTVTLGELDPLSPRTPRVHGEQDDPRRRHVAAGSG